MKNGISIITIVLNGIDEIEETIESVLNQTGLTIEYIIIDGGSVDGTVEKILLYKDKIAHFVSGKDAGIYDAINKGIGLANYPLIGIIHSGDKYCDNTLENIYKLYLDTNADVIYGDILIKETINSNYLYKKLTANHEMLLEYMSIFHPSTFIKKEIYEREGYYDTFFKSAADYDFLVKLFIKKKRFVYYPMTISIFNNQGISSKNFTLSLKENYVINTKHKSIFKSKLIYFKMIIEHHYFEIRKRVLIFILGKEKLGTLKAHLYSKK